MNATMSAKQVKIFRGHTGTASPTRPWTISLSVCVLVMTCPNHQSSFGQVTCVFSYSCLLRSAARNKFLSG